MGKYFSRETEIFSLNNQGWCRSSSSHYYLRGDAFTSFRILLLLRNLHLGFDISPRKSVKFFRSQFLVCRCELPSNMVPASQALGDGPGISGEPAVFCRWFPNQSQILRLVQSQRFVNMTVRIDKSSLGTL